MHIEVQMHTHLYTYIYTHGHIGSWETPVSKTNQKAQNEL